MVVTHVQRIEVVCLGDTEGVLFNIVKVGTLLWGTTHCGLTPCRYLRSHGDTLDSGHEVRRVSDDSTLAAVLYCIRTIFTRCNLPDEVVEDT